MFGLSQHDMDAIGFVLLAILPSAAALLASYLIERYELKQLRNRKHRKG